MVVNGEFNDFTEDAADKLQYSNLSLHMAFAHWLFGNYFISYPNVAQLEIRVYSLMH